MVIVRRVDGGCLSYGVPALPAHLHLLPAPFFRFCAGDIDEYMDIFLDTEATKEAVIQAGILPFSSTFIMDQILHWGKFATCSQGRRWQESNQRLYLQQRVQLHSMPLRAYTCRPGTGSFYRESLNPSDYGWTLGVHGYEPVPTLDPMAPEGLLKFTSCNCHGDCSNQRCICKKNGVMCISACGVCQGITCKNSSHDVVESEEDRQ